MQYELDKPILMRGIEKPCYGVIRFGGSGLAVEFCTDRSKGERTIETAIFICFQVTNDIHKEKINIIVQADPQ